MVNHYVKDESRLASMYHGLETIGGQVKLRHHVGIDVSGVYTRMTTAIEAAGMPVSLVSAGCDSKQNTARENKLCP